MDFTISDVLQAAEARAGLLSAEAAAFLVLSVSEDPGLALCAPDPNLLSLCPGGAVARGPLRAAAPAEVDRKLRALLAQLLRVSVGVTEPLQGVSEASGASLQDFRRDLRAALVPLNRSAAQRGLSRLHRRLVETFEEVELAPPGRGVEPVLALPEMAAQGSEVPVAWPAAEAGVSRRENRRPIAAVAPPLPVPAGVLVMPPPLPAMPALPAMATHQGVTSAPLPVPVYPSQFPGIEVPESVTPYLGSLELDEREAPVLLHTDAAHWDDELLGLTDPAARVAWETEGGALVSERAVRSTPPSDDASGQNSASPIADEEVEFQDEEGETARLWPLPASEARQFLNPRTAAQGASAAQGSLSVAPRFEQARAPYLAQFRSEKPASADLLREYLTTPSPPLPDVKQVLRRFVNDSQEAAPSNTPPPVATEENPDFAASALGNGGTNSGFSGRASVSLGAAVLLASGAMMFGRSAPEVNVAATPEPPSVALNALEPARECFADVHVETEVAAIVKLVTAETRLSAVGPHAVFHHVPCGEDARIAVAFAQGDKAPARDAEWLQVPLPEERLRAAHGASPIVVRAFADAETTPDTASAL